MAETENFQGKKFGDEEWCRRMEELARQQVKYAKKQYIWTCISVIMRAAVLAAVIVAVAVCIPKLTELAGQASQIAGQVESSMAEVRGMMTNLETVAKGIESLTSSGSQGSAAPALNADFERLIETLEKLREAVNNMPKIF